MVVRLESASQLDLVSSQTVRTGARTKSTAYNLPDKRRRALFAGSYHALAFFKQSSLSELRLHRMQRHQAVEADKISFSATDGCLRLLIEIQQATSISSNLFSTS